MTRHYVENHTFALFRPGDDKALTVGPNGFFDIPKAYQGDPTYQLALKAGAIKPFASAKQGDRIEKAAKSGQGGKKPPRAAAPNKPAPAAEPEKDATAAEPEKDATAAEPEKDAESE